MNKKQLAMQNSSLFAELERKAKELEILNIRLEESEQKAKTVADEIEALKESLKKADSENQKLFEKNKELEAELNELKVKITEKATVISEAEAEVENESAFEVLGAETDQEIPEATEIDLEIQQKINEVTEMVENTEPTDEADQALEEATEENSSKTADKKDETVTEVLTPPAAANAERFEASLPAEDLLRDYGAKIIGKVTRVTAEVLSKISAVNDDAAESLKTLALGKNESFKFQIMELAKRKADPEKTMAEMDLLADEAIVYLRSI